MKKIDIMAVPELRTSVGMHGSLKQKEVAGLLCLGLLIAVIMALKVALSGWRGRIAPPPL